MVTQALELSVDPAAMERMTGQGTSNLGAYLAFLQGRTLLASARVVDMTEAIEHFERSVKLDPTFAGAYVSLAEAEVFLGEYEVTDDRQERFKRALLRGQELVEKALALDPNNGAAYLQRAHLAAYENLATAEADYRHGLELSPNSAEGYAGLAAVVYATPSRRDEVLELLDRARKLDPLEPGHDVTKAQFLWFERADIQGANALLVDVLKRNPRYTPALAWLGGLREMMKQAANGIRYSEQALALDPSREWTRRALIRGYVDLGDLSAAKQLLEDEGSERSPRQLRLLMHEGDWRQAGELAYESLVRERESVSGTDMLMIVSAIRMHARATDEFERARAALQEASGVSWDSAGRATLPQEGSPVRAAAIGLADVLLASGQERQGRQLLATILARMRHEVRELGRSEFWYQLYHPTALALSGQDDAAMAMIERSIASGSRADGLVVLLRFRAGVRPDASGRALPGDAAQGACLCRSATGRTRPHAGRRAGARSHRRAVRTWRYVVEPLADVRTRVVHFHAPWRREGRCQVSRFPISQFSARGTASVSSTQVRPVSILRSTSGCAPVVGYRYTVPSWGQSSDGHAGRAWGRKHVGRTAPPQGRAGSSARAARKRINGWAS